LKTLPQQLGFALASNNLNERVTGAEFVGAIELYHTQGKYTVSIDEQTGIQAIERIAADLLPRSGMLACRKLAGVSRMVSLP
jgi:hypothetical protein